MWEEVAKNKRQSWLLFFFFFLFILVVGGFIGWYWEIGYWGTVISFFIAGILIVGSFYNSDKIVLAISRARPATHKEHTFLDNTVEGLAIAAQIPKPKIYVIEDTAPNAFATGRDPEHAVVCVTTGLMQKMNRVELEGVLAHEISHIKNYDIRFMMLVTVMVGSVVLLSDVFARSMFYGRGRREGGGALVLIGLVFVIFTPIIAQLMKFALSRQREYLADANGALLTRYPEGLASALEKLKNDKEPLEAANKATAHLYIINPLNEHKSRLNNMFSTHPPIEDRVKRLRAM